MINQKEKGDYTLESVVDYTQLTLTGVKNGFQRGPSLVTNWLRYGERNRFGPQLAKHARLHQHSLVKNLDEVLALLRGFYKVASLC